ncbi:MAG TPA: PIG-L deacetylase family protein [Methylomirabilota bacterium]|nr:PIG-L deacetylase family protein [Methylomirabilota bacterium]
MAPRSAPKEPPAPARAMSIHAHPDDQEFTVAGTLAKWARAGCEIVSVCITSGGAGSNKYTPLDMTRHALVTIREDEQREACRILGVKETIFLGYEDGALEPSIGLRRELTRLIRRHRPEAVLTGDPTVRYYGTTYMNHPDHRAAADVALDAVFPSAGTRLIFPELLDEGLDPHEVRQVYIHGAERPDTYVDIAEFLDVKVAALRAHKSQMGEWDPSEMITQWAREQGRRRKLTAAESYRRMLLSDL